MIALLKLRNIKLRSQSPFVKTRQISRDLRDPILRRRWGFLVMDVSWDAYLQVWVKNSINNRNSSTEWKWWNIYIYIPFIAWNSDVYLDEKVNPWSNHTNHSTKQRPQLPFFWTFRRIARLDVGQPGESSFISIRGIRGIHCWKCVGESLTGWWFEPLWKIWKSIGMRTATQY